MAQQGFAARPEETTPQNNLEIDPKVLQPQREPPSRFSAPVPGESLTATPKNMPFEKPPQFVDLDEATEFVWDNLNKRDNALKLLALLDKQVPVDGLAKSILFSGFASGKWSPDLSILMITPVVAMIMAIGEGAGIKMRTRTKKKSDSDRALEEIINVDTGKLNG